MKTPEQWAGDWLAEYEQRAGGHFNSSTRLKALLILKKSIDNPGSLSDPERVLVREALDTVEREILENPLQFSEGEREQ